MLRDSSFDLSCLPLFRLDRLCLGFFFLFFSAPCYHLYFCKICKKISNNIFIFLPKKTIDKMTNHENHFLNNIIDI